MFAEQKILRIFAFITWTVCFSYMYTFFRTGFFRHALILIIVLGLLLAALSEIKKIPVTASAGIFAAIIISYVFFIAYHSGRILTTPIALILLTVASAMFISKTVLFLVSAVWNVAFFAFIIIRPDIAFEIYTPVECFCAVIVMECAVFFSYYFIDMANKQIKYSKKMTEKAKNAQRVKGEFLANMSHEIRTPMNAIVGMAELIMDSGADTSVKDIQERALHIKNSGATLVNLINDIMEITKIEQGDLKLFDAPYDVMAMINSAIEIINIKASDKRLILLTNINVEDEPELIGDAQRIKQILLNILSNAVKYTEQGHIFLKVSQSYNGNGVNLNISVSDTGIGIKEEDLSKMFGTFQKFDVSRNKHIEGTGLGLSITKSFLDAMGGTIEVESVYGQGTKFILRIPQKLPLHKPTEESAPVKHKRFKVINTRVLVVDDNKVNLAVTTGLFKLYNLAADTAISGMQALKMVAETQYDIIFMDHMMPEMDGLETVAAIRGLNIEWCKTVPIVALTANAMAGMEQVFLKSGMNAFVAKPINLPELERTLLMFTAPENIIETEEKEACEDEAGDDMLEIEGVNVQQGIDFCGGVYDGYIEVLHTHYFNAPAKLEILESSYKNGDIARLTLEAHSLKSESRGIGAAELGDMAAELERAGNSKDISYINENAERLFEEYRRVVNNIGKALNKTAQQDSGKEIAGAILLEKLENIIKFTEDYDLESAKVITEELMAYNLDENAYERIVRIKGAIMQFSYSDTIEEAKKLINELEK